MAPAGSQLLISGGGGTQVATDAVFAEMATMRRLQGEAELWQDRVARVRELGVGASVTWAPDDLGACLLGASVAITAVADGSRELADGLADAAENYDRLETGLDTALRVAGAGLAYQVGLVTRLLGPLLLVAAAAPALGAASAMILANLAQGRPVFAPPPWLAEAFRDPRLLTNPVTVAVVRALVTSADDAGVGAAVLPFPFAAALGDDGAGLLGAQSSAVGVLVAARAAGMLRETAVRVRQVGASAGPLAGAAPAATPVARHAAGAVHQSPGRATSATRPAGGTQKSTIGVPGPTAVAGLDRPTPPTGFADLADRIPTAADGGQVRIERYGDAGHPTWLVYIGGTVEWSPTGSTEPWDMASNVAAVADQDAGSYRAVLQALEQAGVRPGDPVLPVAHSQGGVIANELVARGAITAVGVVTFGAPETTLTLPENVPAIAVEHSDDLIPALGGHPGSDDTHLYVRRELFAGREIPPDAALPAHQLVGYRDTARLLDGSAEPRLLAFREQLGGLVGTTAGEQAVWRGERVE
ncbi:hypothetical protein [Cryobacterium arcticum]|uniref:hypothetical protein n=1 Tax=Cryobacterium arcticum TaxID=670052 RepID=UPI0011B5B72F|nr:hypothetical protein [Cryobacterium arcticum]